MAMRTEFCAQEGVAGRLTGLAMKKRTLVGVVVLATIALATSAAAGRRILRSKMGACRFDWRSPWTYVAACNGDLETLRALAYRDPSINQPNPSSGSCAGWRPIIIAAAEGKAEADRRLGVTLLSM